MTTATIFSPFARLWNRIRSAFGKPAAQPAPWFDGAGSAFADLHAEPPPRRQPVPVAAVKTSAAATPIMTPKPAAVAKPTAARLTPAKLPVTTADSAGVAAAARAAAQKAAYNASVKAHDANAASVEAALRQAFAAADRPTAVAPVRAPVAARSVPAAPVAQAAKPAATSKALRSLEEVRADLARLRETTRARHAKAYEERDTNFAPTDFMDYAATRVETNKAPQFAAYAPTEFMDFSDLKLPPVKSDRSNPER